MTTTELIDFILKKRNMSRRELAKSAGIPPSTLQSAMEKGKIVKRETLQKIATALGIPESFLSETRELPMEAVKAIAKALEVNPAEIDDRFVINLGSDVIVTTDNGEILTVPMATREGKLLCHFQCLDDDDKQLLIEIGKLLHNQPKYEIQQPERRGSFGLHTEEDN